MIHAHLLLTVGPGKEYFVAQKLKKLKETLDVDIVYGQFDIIAKVELEKINDLQEFVIKKIRPISGITSSSTLIAVGEE